MKDFLLIDSGLPIQFWAEAMDTINYLQNKLLIRCINRAIIIPKKFGPESDNTSNIFGFQGVKSVHISLLKSDIS